MTRRCRSRFRGFVSVVLALAVVFSPPLSTEAYGFGFYCHTTKKAYTNDTSKCIENSNGTAGCEGQIREYAKVGECREYNYPSWCLQTCTEREIDKWVEYDDVVPQSSVRSLLSCLLIHGGLTLAGAGCVASALGGKIAGIIASKGTSELAIGALTTVIVIACGDLAASSAKFLFTRPCCYTYCVIEGDGTPGGGKVRTC